MRENLHITMTISVGNTVYLGAMHLNHEQLAVGCHSPHPYATTTVGRIFGVCAGCSLRYSMSESGPFVDMLVPLANGPHFIRMFYNNHI